MSLILKEHLTFEIRRPPEVPESRRFWYWESDRHPNS